jgi:hypothetical protein
VREGVAAEAAQERAFADLVKVRGLADVLHESAAIARRGAETLYSVKQSVLDAVKDASSAGYIVGEDLSVTYPRGGVATQAQAQVYAAHIQERAVQLAAQLAGGCRRNRVAILVKQLMAQGIGQPVSIASLIPASVGDKRVV